MADICRARVCAVGSDRDLCRLFRAMVRTAGYEPEKEPGERDVEGWLGQVQEIVRAEYAEAPKEAHFLYGMICAEPYGDAEPSDCFLEVRREECGLWTALFRFQGETPFQNHDWLELHRRSGMVLMEAIYAETFPGAPRGGLILSGGRALDDWDHMDAAWLYLISRYGSDEGLVERDEALRLLLTDEADDAEEEAPEEGVAEEILRETGAFLADTARQAADPEGLLQAMRAAVEARDYPTLLECQLTVADTRLWETDRTEEWSELIRRMETD